MGKPCLFKYPLTNVYPRRYRGGHSGPPVPSALVRDADGNIMLTFIGAPYRKNAEAVQMASDFCRIMNGMAAATDIPSK